MSRTYYYHADCAYDDGHVNTDAGDVIFDDTERYEDGDGCPCCEVCGEPSAADAEALAKAVAYWTAYFSGGMRAHMREQHALDEATDSELTDMSRDCGKRLTRGK